MADTRSAATILGLSLLAGSAAPAHAEEPPMYDLTRKKVLYCVGYAHLDTQWRWDFCTTIDKYIRDTLEQNFALFEKYPGYVFNFTGSVRYEMMQEYYPEHYAKLREHVAAGRWCVSGSSVDEGDVNVPAAETIIRHVLYGNRFFRREFNKESVDFMLPDCFGFPASMPTLWAHCGLKGFSTQKLTWGSAVGIPFKIGVWEGPDGEGVIAAFDPGPYVGAVKGRVDQNPDWVQRVNQNGEKYGVFADYHYYGVGDQGGAPHEEDVANYLRCVDQPDSQIHIALTASDQMYKDITTAQRARLPRYKGDLLLTEHSAGTLTSQAYMKRWNRKNEQLADAAERAAVAAQWLRAADYPREKLYKSWVRVLANQMHDILPGTSIPRAYTYSWNDEIIASNGFAAVLTASVGAIAAAMNTQTDGVPLIVYNPLAFEREDCVEAVVEFPGEAPPFVRVYGPRGVEVPAQILARDGSRVRILFLARTPPVSLGVYDVRASDAAPPDAAALTVSESILQNEFLRVTLNADGDIASITDRTAGDRELLAAPARLVFTYERPANWPAWNMDWADRQKPPIAALAGPARVTITERGPVRTAVRIERSARNSTIVQELRLTAGDAGRRLEIKTDIDWQSTECALKASFPLVASNPKATYNWEVGTIQRGNNDPTKYEVPSHQWLDLSDAAGGHGVSILEDCKYGSDKPADNEVRLTLLYTPGVRSGYLDQHSQDWGRHEMTYGLISHGGDWRTGGTEQHARRLNQPLRAFQTERHAGDRGREFSLLNVSTPQVDVRAIKLAEDHSDWLIVRTQELWGRDAKNVEIGFNAPLAEAYECDGQERRIGDALIQGGKLVFSTTAYRPRTFAVKLPTGAPPAPAMKQQPVILPFDADVISRDANRADGGFDADGRTIPAEMLPPEIVSEGVRLRLGPSEDGQKNAVTCRGQEIPLPAGDFSHVYLLAAATEDATARFVAAGREQTLTIAAWTGFIGQWDDRIWDVEFGEVDHRCEGKVIGLRPGFIKRDRLAWFCTHRHHPQAGNEAYKFSYLFMYALPLGAGPRVLTLPDDSRIRILSATIAANAAEVTRPAAPLYDDFTNRPAIELRHQYPPPPKPVFEGVQPTAVVTADRQKQYAALSIGPPSAGDYADAASGREIQFRVCDGEGRYRPHGRSGEKNGSLPRLNDGEAAQNDDDTARCVWYDSEGRFYADLGADVPIARINTYSWHRSNRAPQYFSLWAARGDRMPPADFAHGGHEGWTLLAVVNTRDLGDGDIHGTSVHATAGDLGPYRYLLWVAEDMSQGTFFTEIDVHVRP